LLDVCRDNLLEMAGSESENSVEAMRLELLVKRLALAIFNIIIHY